MGYFVTAVIVLSAGGLAALAAGRNARLAGRIGTTSALAGCALALLESLSVLADGRILSMRLPWSVPLGSLALGLDPLSALFAAPIALVSALAAVYGGPYLEAHAGRKNLGVCWLLLNLLIASMLLVVVARNGLLFLLAWELMSLSSLLLVMFESQQESVRRAGWIYLVATHLGTAMLLAMFCLLGRGSGTLDFGRFAAAPGTAGLIFVLALIGFGTKAGMVPLHVWLPEAHPAAPSHVSAVMSGVMIKTGIYGLVRTLMFLGPPPAWWGWTLLGVGAVSGILGVLFALAQHDLKRLLAYHSVENIGIIAMGLGLGMLGVSYGSPAMAALGFAGGLLHVLNHAVFKSLLFLGAGAVLHATGTRDLDHLGGLLKRMPTTGLTFLVGAVAICGLPPLNGFVSELLIYLGAFQGLTESGRSPDMSWPLLSILVIGALALIGGLAAACFTKAFGVVFLGEPRTQHAAHAHEAPMGMRLPMLILAATCALIALAAPGLPTLLRPVVEALVPHSMQKGTAAGLAIGTTALWWITPASVACVALAALLALVRRRLLAGRPVGQTPTWDCGYAAPTPRMQYTASSFARPLTHWFRMLLRTREEIHAPEGFFPTKASLHTETPDPFRESFYAPVFLGVRWVASKLRWLQQGRIQLYVLYIAVTLLVLLVWKLRQP